MISRPHSYPLFYEALGLHRGDQFLGVGSSCGTALAMEIVGPQRHVVSIELDPLTLEFAKASVERAGYADVVLVQGDGRGLGFPPHARYDRICVTAACPDVPPPLLE